MIVLTPADSFSLLFCVFFRFNSVVDVVSIDSSVHAWFCVNGVDRANIRLLTCTSPVQRTQVKDEDGDGVLQVNGKRYGDFATIQDLITACTYTSQAFLFYFNAFVETYDYGESESDTSKLRNHPQRVRKRTPFKFLFSCFIGFIDTDGCIESESKASTNITVQALLSHSPTDGLCFSPKLWTVSRVRSCPWVQHFRSPSGRCGSTE